MRAGELNKRIIPQLPTQVQNDIGELIPGWANFVNGGDGKVWASIKDITGKEFVAAGATQNETTTEIKVRYQPGYKKNMRVLHEADIYNVTEVLGQDKAELKLMCKRLSP